MVIEKSTDVQVREREGVPPAAGDASPGPHGALPVMPDVPRALLLPDVESAPELYPDAERLGLIEVLLAEEHYRSVLELGCGAGDLAVRLAGHCARYVGMDDDADALAAARRGVCAGRFLPLSPLFDEPSRLPSGEHELVVLSDVLHRLDAGTVERLGEALREHAPCREIIVVSAHERCALGTSGKALGRFAAILSERFEHHEMALRERYRIDALLPREDG